MNPWRGCLSRAGIYPWDNGIGNVELPKSTQKPLEEPACDFIIRKAEELKGN